MALVRGVDGQYLLPQSWQREVSALPEAWGPDVHANRPARRSLAS